MAEIKITADSAEITTSGRTFVFNAEGNLDSVQRGVHTRKVSLADAERLSKTREPAHKDSQPVYEAVAIAMKNEALHAAGADLTGRPETPKATTPVLKPKPDGFSR